MFNFNFLNLIGNWLGEDPPIEETGDPIDFESGPLLDCGISWVYLFKRLIMPHDLRTKVGHMRCVSVCKNKGNVCKT